MHSSPLKALPGPEISKYSVNFPGDLRIAKLSDILSHPHSHKTNFNQTLFNWNNSNTNNLILKTTKWYSVLD